MESCATRPEITGEFGRIPGRLTGAHTAILEPDKNEAEWWAGAPSVVRGPAGDFWLACRMRSPDQPRGLRGYEIRILHSKDGLHFTRVHSIRRELVPIPGFERPALLIDPRSGKYKLYGCGPWQEGPWAIVKFDDADLPSQFVPHTARLVIGPQSPAHDRDILPAGYKDPVVLFAEDAYQAYVIGYLRQNERIYHFQSDDGEEWRPVGHRNESLLPLSGWHDFFVRPASVVPVGAGYLFVYEGSSATWHDPVYNIATGLGFTFDLHHVIDLTPDSPLAISSTPSERFGTFRYSQWIEVDGELWVYAEVARPNESNEIRLFRLSR